MQFFRAMLQPIMETCRKTWPLRLSSYSGLMILELWYVSQGYQSTLSSTFYS